MSRKLSCGAGPVSPQVAARYPPGCDDTGPALEGSSIGREKRPWVSRCSCFPASARGTSERLPVTVPTKRISGRDSAR